MVTIASQLISLLRLFLTHQLSLNFHITSTLCSKSYKGSPFSLKVKAKVLREVQVPLCPHFHFLPYYSFPFYSSNYERHSYFKVFVLVVSSALNFLPPVSTWLTLNYHKSLLKYYLLNKAFPNHLFRYYTLFRYSQSFLISCSPPVISLLIEYVFYLLCLLLIVFSTRIQAPQGQELVSFLLADR